MKLLYVQYKMHNYAGMERILSAKMNYLAEKSNHKVFFTTYEQQNKELPFKLSDNVIYIPITTPIAKREQYTFTKWIPAFIKTRNLFRTNFYSLVKEINPDLIICTVYTFSVLDIIVKSSLFYNKKIVIESHTKASTILMSNKFQYNKLIYHVIKRWDNHILKQLKYTSCIVTLTQADTKFWKKYANRVEVIPNMITILPHIVSNYNSKQIISVGRYSYEKGYDMLLRAWSIVIKKLPEWKLYIYGNGDASEYISIIKHYKLQESVFCMPATKDIVSEYTKSSIYVMSSRYEGFGLVLTEAMSCGLPCISFDCPYGPSEIIKDGEDGYLVEKNNINMFAEKMEILMNNLALRSQMGMKAQVNVNRYNIDNVMKKWIDLFDKI
jgi:glycosyltransferase involved in cell wall biosynthesis